MNDGGASLGERDDGDETKEMEENQDRAADGRTIHGRRHGLWKVCSFQVHTNAIAFCEVRTAHW